MTLKEKLQQLVNASPRGTLITVEGLAELIEGAEDDVADLSVEDVAKEAAERFGRSEPYTPGAIRKWIHTGLNGVLLAAYPYGRTYRVQVRDFEAFVAAVRGQKHAQPARDSAPADVEYDDSDEFDAEVRSAASRSYAANR